MKASNFLKVNYPGVILVVLLSQKYAGPVMLFAILIGLALHPAYESDNLKAGVDWCARPLLLTGVALLGFRVNFNDFIALGLVSPLITMACIKALLVTET